MIGSLQLHDPHTSHKILSGGRPTRPSNPAPGTGSILLTVHFPFLDPAKLARMGSVCDDSCNAYNPAVAAAADWTEPLQRLSSAAAAAAVEMLGTEAAADSSAKCTVMDLLVDADSLMISACPRVSLTYRNKNHCLG